MNRGTIQRIKRVRRAGSGHGGLAQRGVRELAELLHEHVKLGPPVVFKAVRDGADLALKLALLDDLFEEFLADAALVGLVVIAGHYLTDAFAFVHVDAAPGAELLVLLLDAGDGSLHVFLRRRVGICFVCLAG
jgi:hypothetical protein